MSKKSVEFHIKSNDYFGTAATVLSLVKQTPEYISKHINVCRCFKHGHLLFN